MLPKKILTKIAQEIFLMLSLKLQTVMIMTFLMMLSVILLSMLMIPRSILRVIRHLIFGNNLICLLNLNLIYKTLFVMILNFLNIDMTHDESRGKL